MPDGLRIEAMQCAQKLAAVGRTITDATNHLLAHLAAVERSCSVSELLTKFISAKSADGARDLYVKDLKNRLVRFELDFGTRTVAEIRSEEIGDWLRALGVAPQTRNNFRTVLRTFFQFAVDADYSAANPVERTSEARVERKPPAVFTPTQMRALLNAAPRDFLPWLAIGGFAGLRSAEIERLDWSEIDLAERLIKIPASKSKTGKKRNVRITENLAAWLTPLAAQSGEVANLDRVRVAREATVRAAGMIKWETNALRHSFASYHIAFHEDASKTAYQLGHSSPKMLKEHYDAVVLRKDATQWWEIMPPTDHSNVVAFGVEVANA